MVTGYELLLGTPLYDGNIAAVETHIGKTTPNGKHEALVGETYRYDMLGRLDSSHFHTFDTSTRTWSASAEAYKTGYEYDANGNITKLMRHGYDSASINTQMDSLAYAYANPNKNRLDSVHEAVTG